MAEQLIVEFVGAFFGFFFGAVLTSYQEKRSQRKKYRLVLDSLINELRDITRVLQKYIDSHQRLKTRIAIPTWNAIQYSGITLELIDKPYFEDLINTYSLIKAYNADIPEPEDGASRLVEIVESGKKTLRQVTAARIKGRK